MSEKAKPEDVDNAETSRLRSIRSQVAVQARKRRSRLVQFSREAPCDWRPHQVFDPSTGEYFTESGAWNLIADLFEKGHPLEEIVLQRPAGKAAFVMLVDLTDHTPDLYIKIQLGNGKVIGRSFHYSTVIS